MTILCVIDDLTSGGYQKQLVTFAKTFKQLGYGVEFLYYYDKNFYEETLKQAHINVTCINEKRPISRILKLRKFIRNGNFDVVIAYNTIPAFISEIAALPFKKWKLIVGEGSSNPAIKKSCRSRFIRLFHIFSDYVVANSHTNLRMVRDVNPFLRSKNCLVIYNGIDLNVYCPPSNYNFKKDGLLSIIIPASYRRLKNLLGLIEAVNLLEVNEKEQLRIDYFGDKSLNYHKDSILIEAEILIKKYNLESVFSLYPAVFDIHVKIKQYDAVGLFSFFEGLPNAVCEGMACGKPIIASAVSDVPLIVTNNENGFLCNAEDIGSITKALRNLINTSPGMLEEMGKIGRERALLLFDKDCITEKYVNLLES